MKEMLYAVRCLKSNEDMILLIMDHVLRSLKKQHPEIVRSFFRQDNAGCYHSAQTILSVDILSKRSGIQVTDVDFSDPQGGKGSCDRKALHLISTLNCRRAFQI